ncbi:uncharacterized protein LOC130980704 [Arachis stenosperma]|uniref:uncharacterized protein LOC130980704 n=1 Tax=Arachis stenosperma TaxID=217475 RepID=UPI0025AD9B30|nr:uncharacterized protein LOC130980704 [Arachis stenosperma]
MAARGRGRHGTNHAEESTRGADAFIAAMNTMAEAVHETATATTRAIDHLGERNGDRNGGLNGECGGDGNDNEGAGNHDNPMTLATFLKVNPPKFKGTLVATEADNWFRGIEKSLRAQHVPERQYVEFATYMLEGKAEHWWHGVQRLLRQVVEEIDWDTFKEEFYKKYFPRTVRDAKEMELMQLTQGNMSVAEYTQKFEDLCRFSKICQENPDDFEEWKCLKYEGGLCEELMHSLVPLQIRNFPEPVPEEDIPVEQISVSTSEPSSEEPLAASISGPVSAGQTSSTSASAPSEIIEISDDEDEDPEECSDVVVISSDDDS